MSAAPLARGSGHANRPGISLLFVKHMELHQRVVTHQPVTELWREDGFCTSKRESQLTPEEVASLVRAGPVQFVVSTVGGPLVWILVAHRFDVWKSEIKPHLAAPGGQRLESFPDEYCYFASRWAGESLPIILLETHH